MSETSGDCSPRRMAPQDGGRGREIRRRWSCIRWFSWRYGTAWWRTHLTHLSLSWHAFNVAEVLVGTTTYKDEDGDRHVLVGLGPLLRLDVWWTPWARPGALGWRYGGEPCPRTVSDVLAVVGACPTHGGDNCLAQFIRKQDAFDVWASTPLGVARLPQFDDETEDSGSPEVDR